MNKLRPVKFKDIVGQKELLDSLSISVTSAKKRDDALSHTLFYGPPGLGKTTLATALANELKVRIQVANGASIKSVKSILPYVTKAKEKSILFIDEIHRLSESIQEFLYPVMEDFKLGIAMDGKILKVDLPKFTMIGATTALGSLSAPFIDRFKLKFELELYDEEELVQLIKVNAKKLHLILDEDSAKALAHASRGTPRIANSLLEWVRDYAVTRNLKSVSRDDLMTSLAIRGISKNGATKIDRQYIQLLKKQKTPIGLSTIASSLNVDKYTIENVIEPFLLRKGLIIKTPKGRTLC